MRVASGAWAGIVAGLLAVNACGGDGRPSDPAQVVEDFAAAARAGDAAAVYGFLGPRTRARLEDILRSAERVSGRLALAPHDFLSVGRAPPSWDATSVRTVKRDVDDAVVEVFSATGERHDTHLVREGAHWKIELPGS